jgi:hypothetical protein
MSTSGPFPSRSLVNFPAVRSFPAAVCQWFWAGGRVPSGKRPQFRGGWGVQYGQLP